jgi:hypothetical protein
MAAWEGDMMLVNRTVSGNTGGTNQAGGVYGNYSSITLNSSTISGNGGFGVRSNGASIALSKSTIADNASSGLDVEDVCDYESYKITLNSTLYLRQHWLWYLSRVGATNTG